MTTNEQVRQELSYGIGERQEQTFTVTHKEPEPSIVYLTSLDDAELWLAKRAS